MSKRLEDKIAVITGASRGIGRAVALAFAREGAHTILVARSVAGLEAVDDEISQAGGNATLVPLDLTDFDGIDRLGASIFERWGKLDIAVGNAAILGTLTPLTHITPKDWSALLDINITANWRLIRSLDPLLRRSEAGRAIFVSTSKGVVHGGRPYWGGYATTKAALEAMVKTYANECEKTPVRVNIIDPGAVRTEMRAQAMPGEDPQTLPPPAEVAKLFVTLAEASYTGNGEIVNYEAWRPANR